MTKTFISIVDGDYRDGQKIKRAIYNAQKATTAGNGWVTLSDATEDRMGDVVDPGGWDLRAFQDNPVMLYGHDYSDLPLGTWEVRTEPRRLAGKPRFSKVKEHDRARLVKALWDEGVLCTVSVGFKPIDWEQRDTGGTYYKRQELLEVSIVPVPANPNAHKQVMKALGLTAREAEKVLIIVNDKPRRRDRQGDLQRLIMKEHERLIRDKQDRRVVVLKD